MKDREKEIYKEREKEREREGKFTERKNEGQIQKAINKEEVRQKKKDRDRVCVRDQDRQGE